LTVLLYRGSNTPQSGAKRRTLRFSRRAGKRDEGDGGIPRRGEENSMAVGKKELPRTCASECKRETPQWRTGEGRGDESGGLVWKSHAGSPNRRIPLRGRMIGGKYQCSQQARGR